MVLKGSASSCFKSRINRTIALEVPLVPNVLQSCLYLLEASLYLALSKTVI